MTRAYLSIGSNIAPAQNIRKCIICLREEFGRLEVSSIYRCAAVGFEGEDFLNLVIGLETELEPKRLSNRLKALEEQLGRRRDVAKFSDRWIDIDLLLHGLNEGDFDGLKLPRNEILKYPFVLLPLAELAPDLVHPLARRSLQELWREMSLAGHDLVMIDPSLTASILD